MVNVILIDSTRNTNTSNERLHQIVGRIVRCLGEGAAPPNGIRSLNLPSGDAVDRAFDGMLKADPTLSVADVVVLWHQPVGRLVGATEAIQRTWSLFQGISWSRRLVGMTPKVIACVAGGAGFIDFDLLGELRGYEHKRISIDRGEHVDFYARKDVEPTLAPLLDIETAA